MEPPRIFVSYRRRDATGYAISIVEGISRNFGEHQVFQDLRDLEGGDEWSKELFAAIAASKVMVVVIGPTWVKWHAPGSVTPALYLDGDPVRREIEAAFTNGVTLLPVLIGGAAMPSKADLPVALARITDIQAIELSDLRWPKDMQRLCDALARALWGRPAGAAVMRLRRLNSRAIGSVPGRAMLNVLCFGSSLWLQTVSTWPLPPLVADAASALLLWLLAAAWILPSLRPRQINKAARQARSSEPVHHPTARQGSPAPRPSALLLAACVVSSLAAAQATRGPASALAAGSWTFCATLAGSLGSPRQLQFLDLHARPVTTGCLPLDDDTGLKQLRRPSWYSYRPTHVLLDCSAKGNAPIAIPEFAFDGTCSREVTAP